MPGLIYVIEGGGGGYDCIVAASGDSGVTWRTPVADPRICRLVVGPGAGNATLTLDDELRTTANGGTTWSTAATPVPSVDGHLAASPTALYFTDSTDALFRSTDHGGTWDALGAAPGFVDGVDAADPSSLFFGTATGLVAGPVGGPYAPVCECGEPNTTAGGPALAVGQSELMQSLWWPAARHGEAIDTDQRTPGCGVERNTECVDFYCRATSGELEMSREDKTNNHTKDVRDDTDERAVSRRNILLGTSTLVAAAAFTSNALAQAQKAAPAGPATGPAPAPAATASGRKPNILVIWGDDIGIANISAYSDGLMGYETPGIDRIAREGLKFQHYYGEQSCTAGRAAFLTGQHGIRTGLTKVGFPGAPMGMSQLDPSIGGLLKNLGYGTGQFGKNHVGDRNESLPTVNGFDEFFGNLYHLNAEEEPELPDYPKDPAYRAKFGPRGVLKCKATDRDDPTVDPRFGKIGKQTIEDTGALTKKRMETIDDETSAAAIDYMKRQQAAGKPFFGWFNSTRMHLRTHVRAEHRGRYTHGDSEYIDGMLEHDDTVGSLLKALDEHGHRERHHRRLLQRQRSAHEHLARRRHDLVSLGEEHQLGGRLPRAVPGSVASRHQARHRHQ